MKGTGKVPVPFAVSVGMTEPRNCLYCGEQFIPKRRDSTCCTRLHSQQYNRVGRPRIASYVPPPALIELPPCCQDAGKTCPQHQLARKMRHEEIQWNDRWRQFVRTFGTDPEGADCALAGFTIS